MLRKKIQPYMVVLHLLFILISLCFVLPLMLIISASFTSEAELTMGGFHLLPANLTTEAYRLAFRNPKQIINSYGITIAQSVLGTALSMVVAAMAAYPLSRSNFLFKKPVTVLIFFTMLFSAGMIPNYITFAKYYHLGNTFWIYILPGITGGAWNTMVYRTFFKSLPESLFEAARIDGAKELYIFFRIVIPLSTPVFASLSFMTLVGKWNDYTTSMVYIRDTHLYSLQYLLQRIMNEAAYLKSLMENNPGINIDMSDQMPSESLKYAMCVIAAGPMLLLFPLFQKYFSQGLTVGAVKG